jgi:phage/plasmid primase-like uncharacterized protein
MSNLDDQWHYTDKSDKYGYRGNIGVGQHGQPFLNLTVHDLKTDDKFVLNSKAIVRQMWDDFKVDNAAAVQIPKIPTAADAIAQYHQLPSTGSSPYLERKQVEAAPDIKFGDGFISVPVMDFDTIKTIELIFNDGTKRFTKGTGLKSGNFFAVNGLPAEQNYKGNLVLSEGLATALSLQQARCADYVICCFDKSGLSSVHTKLIISPKQIS